VPPPTCATDAECDDGSACTVDTCEGCSCEHRSACDDGDACTVDACDGTGGCTHDLLEGFAGVDCLCGRDLVAGACAGTTIPRRVARLFVRACRRVARAGSATKAARRRRLLNRGVVTFARARRRLSIAVNHAKLAPACDEAVDADIDAARQRAAELRHSPG
jgi:Dictyostelium (slime mold) repeat